MGVICAPGATKTHTKFKASVYLSKKEEGGRSNPIIPGYQPVFYFRTCDVTGSIKTMAGKDGGEVKMAMPGDDLNIECELIVETPIETGMRFAMREGGRPSVRVLSRRPSEASEQRRHRQSAALLRQRERGDAVSEHVVREATCHIFFGEASII